jgi:hypothetical protein
MSVIPMPFIIIIIIIITTTTTTATLNLCFQNWNIGGIAQLV